MNAPQPQPNPFTISQLSPDDVAELEQLMSQSVHVNRLQLYAMMAFQLGWENAPDVTEQSAPPPRLYGQFLLATASLLGTDRRQAMLCAAAIELLRNSLKIHRDLFEANTDNGTLPSVWWKWGPAQAINTGDGLHTLSRLTLLRMQEQASGASELVYEVLNVFDSCALAIYEGSYAEIDMQERLDTGLEEYLQTVGKVAGEMAACAFCLGGIKQGSAENSWDRLRNFGRHVGIAHRINRDSADMWGDTPDKGALTTKRKSLPVVLVFNSDDPKAKRRLGEIYMQRVIEPEALKEVAQITADMGTEDTCRELQQKHIAAAAEQLEGADLDADAKKQITEIGTAFAEGKWDDKL